LQIRNELKEANNQWLNAFDRSVSGGVFRHLGSSATLATSTLLVESIDTEESINLGITAQSLCDSASSSDCVAP